MKYKIEFQMEPAEAELFMQAVTRMVDCFADVMRGQETTTRAADAMAHELAMAAQGAEHAREAREAQQTLEETRERTLRPVMGALSAFLERELAKMRTPGDHDAPEDAGDGTVKNNTDDLDDDEEDGDDLFYMDPRSSSDPN